MKLEGQAIDVRVYSISPDAQWFYVGHLKSCEVLDEETASAARRKFKTRGWLRDMISQVKHVDGDEQGLKYDDAVSVFNIRYRPSDAVLYDPMVPVEPSDGIRKLRRYILVKLAGPLKAVEREWATRVAATEQQRVGKQVRAGVLAREIDLVHNQLQNELFELLRIKFGQDAVEKESGFVDIKLLRDGRVCLIEIKSDSRPRFAIREALGQLLEYSYAAEKRGDAVGEMLVVGPGEMTTSDRAYIQHLRSSVKLPIRYVCFRRGMAHVDI